MTDSTPTTAPPLDALLRALNAAQALVQRANSIGGHVVSDPADLAALREALPAARAAAEGLARERDEAVAAAGGYQALIETVADNLGVTPAEVPGEAERWLMRAARWKRAAKKWRHLWESEHRLACEWGNDLGMVNNLLQRMKLWRADIKGTHNRVRAALEAVREVNP